MMQMALSSAQSAPFSGPDACSAASASRQFQMTSTAMIQWNAIATAE
ncbi:MAG: hypothetical protein WBA68_02960 [Alteraurantiacibacter sp.]